MTQEALVTGISPESNHVVGSEILARRAKFAKTLFAYVAWCVGILAVGTMALWTLSRQLVQLPMIAVLLAQTAVSMGVFPFLHRRGYTATGFYLALISLVLTCTGGYALVPEVNLAAVCGNIAVATLTCLLLGRRVAIGMTGMIVLLLVADIILARFMTPSWFSPLGEALGVTINLLFAVLAFGFLAAILFRIVLEQESFFRQARLARFDIEARMQTEQEQRKHLEQANQEIQARAVAEREQRENLQCVLDQVRDAANALNAQAAEILATTTQQATGATEQSAAVSQATTTVDEIKTIAGQLVSRAQAVTDSAQRTVQVSRAGQETVRETISGMAQIKARVDVIEENILSLSECTQQIGEIIDTVESIASQSNMLALNAAVEAARAGEHGKGFAVVAEEVRDLAERSKRATAQVKGILSDIQRATNATGMATEEGKKGVDAGVKLVAQMGDAIDQLAEVIDESAQSALQMSIGGQQQTNGVEQISVAMQNINQVTMQGMATTKQVERSAQELNELARSLLETVEQYQV